MKLQTPTSKLQRIIKHQAPDQVPNSLIAVAVWSLEFAFSLEH